MYRNLADGFKDARTKIISAQVFSEIAVNDEIAAKFTPPISDNETVILRISGLDVQDVGQVTGGRGQHGKRIIEWFY
jgi:hypothetical protein